MTSKKHFKIKREIIMTDKELILNIKNEDEFSFGLLIEKYGNYVASTIFYISGKTVTKEDAEELAADVFIAFWKNAKNFNEEQEVKPYLAKIARNKAISKFRKNCASTDIQALSLEEDIVIIEKDATDELAVRREQEDILNEAVKRLKKNEKEIFVRFYYLGQKIADISKKMEIPEPTVKTKLRRSREKLKEAFEKRGYTYYEG